MGRGAMAAQRSLEPFILVRIQAPQPDRSLWIFLWTSLTVKTPTNPIEVHTIPCGWSADLNSKPIAANLPQLPITSLNLDE
jgi:hypothetical protein